MYSGMYSRLENSKKSNRPGVNRTHDQGIMSPFNGRSDF
jgi:hypothetical protein